MKIINVKRSSGYFFSEIRLKIFITLFGIKIKKVHDYLMTKRVWKTVGGIGDHTNYPIEIDYEFRDIKK